MSFAPLNVCNYPHQPRMLDGTFREKCFKKIFEYSVPQTYTPFPGYDRKVWVGNNGDYRWCKVLKTRVHVVIDEKADGRPEVGVWHTTDHREYA